MVLIAWKEPGAWSFATEGRERTGAAHPQCRCTARALPRWPQGFGDLPPALVTAATQQAH